MTLAANMLCFCRVWITTGALSYRLRSNRLKHRCGSSLRSAVLAGSSIWMAIFVILWLGLLNMHMATLGLLAVALPLSWLEMVIAALIVRWGMMRSGHR